MCKTNLSPGYAVCCRHNYWYTTLEFGQFFGPDTATDPSIFLLYNLSGVKFFHLFL